MPKYIVRVRELKTWILEVEAESSEEVWERTTTAWSQDVLDTDPAMAKAIEFAEVQDEDGSGEIISVTEVPKEEANADVQSSKD